MQLALQVLSATAGSHDGKDAARDEGVSPKDEQGAPRARDTSQDWTYAQEKAAGALARDLIVMAPILPQRGGRE